MNNNKSILRFYLTASSIVNAILILFVCSLAWGDEVAVRTVAYEGSNQNLSGQIMIASVIKSRMAQRKQTSTEVCKAPYQFSCWHPKTGAPTQRRKLTQKELEVARQAWSQARPGKYNHYCHYKVKPGWIKAAKSSVRICDHIFYEL